MVASVDVLLDSYNVAHINTKHMIKRQITFQLRNFQAFEVSGHSKRNFRANALHSGSADICSNKNLLRSVQQLTTESCLPWSTPRDRAVVHFYFNPGRGSSGSLGGAAGCELITIPLISVTPALFQVNGWEIKWTKPQKLNFGYTGRQKLANFGGQYSFKKNPS